MGLSRQKATGGGACCLPAAEPLGLWWVGGCWQEGTGGPRALAATELGQAGWASG